MKHYEMESMRGVVISPSGRAGIRRQLRGFARCFSGDTDRVSFPWPYLDNGESNPEYVNQVDWKLGGAWFDDAYSRLTEGTDARGEWASVAQCYEGDPEVEVGQFELFRFVTIPPDPPREPRRDDSPWYARYTRPRRRER